MEKLSKTNADTAILDRSAAKWASLAAPMGMYGFARRWVHEHRQEEFDAAWDRIHEASQAPLTEHFFMKEYAWCVYVSGFSATNVSRIFDLLLKAHRIEDRNGNYVDPTEANVLSNVPNVLKVFRNKKKAEAVQEVRRLVLELGWPKFMIEYLSDQDGKARTPDPRGLLRLPYMGPALSCQLARNLGNLGVVKPDVHLKRLATKSGLTTPQELCDRIADEANEVPAKIDLVLWMTCVDLGSRTREPQVSSR